MHCGVWSVTDLFSKPTGEKFISQKKGEKNTENYIISRQQVTPPPPCHTLPATSITNITVLNLSQCSQSPVKLQLSPKDIGVVHNIVCTKMLYVTVSYVCCLCSEIPMRCHWCCCFRYIRTSSPILLVWFVWSEPIYYSIYLEIFVGTRTYKCCVALPVLNVGFLCVGLFVSLCFSCAFALCFWHVKL